MKKPSIEPTVRKVVRVTECVYVVMGHNLVRFYIFKVFFDFQKVPS